MKHPVLSARMLVRLADNNHLSLLLRHAWREKYGRDPYNNLKTIVAIANGRWVAGGFYLLFLVALVAGVLMTTYPESMFRGWGKVIALSIAFFFVAAGFALLASFVLSQTKQLEQRLGEGFQHHVSGFFYVCKGAEDKCLEDVAKRTASLTPADLEQLAKNIVFGKIAEIEKHDKNADENEGSATWQTTKAEMMERFTLAANTSRIFELVYGSNKDLFREGRRRLAAKDAEAAPVTPSAAPEASAAAPGPAQVIAAVETQTV